MEFKNSYNLAELIGKARDGRGFDANELSHIVSSISNEQMEDAQVGAFAMAIMCKGLSKENGISLTEAMRDSGDVLSWDVDGPIADKHSTGGVGDCVSLLLAPIMAACGVSIPMISGRGLGHTGGTLDKLEAIQGFSTQLPFEKMQAQLQKVGCVMAGQSARLAPADGRLYSIRDVSGTVPSIDLITASILSKKLAAGLETLVLDVKAGRGAFMKSQAEATKLAKRLVDVANALCCPTTALITDMDTPLSSRAGNALEVLEVIEIFKGARWDGKLMAVTKALCIELLVSTGICENKSTAEAKIWNVMESGHAAERFEKMCAAQGSLVSIEKIKNALPKAECVRDVKLPTNQTFNGFDAYEIGMTVLELGGGRKRKEDRINPSVGLSNIAESAQAGDIIATIHARSESEADQAEARILASILDAAPQKQLILDQVI